MSEIQRIRAKQRSRLIPQKGGGIGSGKALSWTTYPKNRTFSVTVDTDKELVEKVRSQLKRSEQTIEEQEDDGKKKEVVEWSVKEIEKHLILEAEAEAEIVQKIKSALECLCMLFEPERVAHLLNQPCDTVNEWRIYQSCGVYVLVINGGHSEYYLVDRVYDHDVQRVYDHDVQRLEVLVTNSFLSNLSVRSIRSDHCTEFQKNTHETFFDEKGISQNFSYQNGVAERRNKTLIEAARSMLTEASLATQFWAEAVNTACYTQNRSLIVKRFKKTTYELFRNKKCNNSNPILPKFNGNT
ncbi:hypothetical protein OSB04_019571 [Centaurea solstitialis]|uniref:Integrase catalytic domain-containing protein n=1 Tax=Centaurea solstitialis TaxID=347529 RepID=A0AA38TA47_9ASTR|nr:hypothetical protein OSB04_019571 [Centaurea solstitialis]